MSDTATARTTESNQYYPTLDAILAAEDRLRSAVTRTPLMRSDSLSRQYGAEIFLKREDQQLVRSYKIRGAYNRILSLSGQQKTNGIVCASAGNHAQGVAYACALLGLKGTIFMPAPTPSQKVQRVGYYGQQQVDIRLVGDTFDDAYQSAIEYCERHQAPYVRRQ